MRQRDARRCTAKADFFRSGDNSPSSGHVTRSALLCSDGAARSSAAYVWFHYTFLHPKRKRKSEEIVSVEKFL